MASAKWGRRRVTSRNDYYHQEYFAQLCDESWQPSAHPKWGRLGCCVHQVPRSLPVLTFWLTWSIIRRQAAVERGLAHTRDPAALVDADAEHISAAARSSCACQEPQVPAAALTGPAVHSPRPLSFNIHPSFRAVDVPLWFQGFSGYCAIASSRSWLRATLDSTVKVGSSTPLT